MESLELYNKIDRLRKDKGWSQYYLSAQAGVSHNTLYGWRTRQTMPTFDVLEALCDALQISLVQLFSNGEHEELPEDNKRLLEYWSTLNRKQKQLVMDLITTLRGSDK